MPIIGRDQSRRLKRRYWTEQATAQRPDGRLIYVLAYPSRAARDADWAAFRNDPEWQKAAKALEESGKLTTKTESVFMTMTDFSPALRLTGE